MTHFEAFSVQCAALSHPLPTDGGRSPKSQQASAAQAAWAAPLPQEGMKYSSAKVSEKASD